MSEYRGPMDSIVYRNSVLRAQQLFADGAVHENGAPGVYDVDSQSTEGVQYQVVIEHDDIMMGGRQLVEAVVGTSCTCPAFKKNQRRLREYLAGGEPDWMPDFIQTAVGELTACKHVKAALMSEGWTFHVAK